MQRAQKIFFWIKLFFFELFRLINFSTYQLAHKHGVREYGEEASKNKNAGYLFLVAFSSCSDDDDEDQVVKNEISLDGTVYSVKSGNIEDYGASIYMENATSSHYNYDFNLSDGDLATEEGHSYFLYAELYSPGTTFKTGTFVFKAEANLTWEDIDGQAFFNYASIDTDFDGDGVLDELEAIGGTITVTGSSPEFTIEFNLILTGGKELRGKYSGIFPVSEG